MTTREDELVERLRAKRCVNAQGIGTAFPDPLTAEAASALTALSSERAMLVEARDALTAELRHETQQRMYWQERAALSSERDLLVEELLAVAGSIGCVGTKGLEDGDRVSISLRVSTIRKAERILERLTGVTGG